MTSIAPTDKRPPTDRAVVREDGISLVDGRPTAAGTSPERKSALARAGRSVWGGIKRVNKVVGEAEARLILRVFYYTVFGVVHLVRRRKPTDGNEQAEVAWSPRSSPTTDPDKQY